MNITFEELRQIKHQLPEGSIKTIAQNLKIDEQTVRNYFGANKYKEGNVVDRHLQPGPHGGIMQLNSTEILDMAKSMI